ncbi:hypothetical protein [Noviherbaspirillum pedocola]|uniref:Uncharacterized protein n=1 Tax=Noviherbaspirillum pedocola TaxID=2801341 RepID=A0A934SX66_9BURK|nr:hypothetical protein [Noviherbaspirillum pedocola]MBK4737299.1 hypothetical protein [Noviherbaspirillum pedocola]
METEQHSVHGKRKCALGSLRAVEIKPVVEQSAPATHIAAMMAQSSALMMGMMLLPLQCFIHATATASASASASAGVVNRYWQVKQHLYESQV